MNFKNDSIKWINAIVYIDVINEQKEYILIEKPESKSRVSYHLINLKEDQKQLLEKLNGKMVEAQIKIVEELSPWNKKAYLLSIKQ
jgi:nucleoside-triphosphatase THEP1